MMQDLQSRTHVQAKARSASPDDRLHMLGVYSAFTVIAAIVFGTLTYHPF